MARTKLSVNINKVALIRNSRGENLPDILQFALDCERYGADGITVHPRPDERHIRYQDVIDLKPIVTTELNVEGYPSERFMDLIRESLPHQCTLVPDPPGVLTSNQGWDIIANKSQLQVLTSELRELGVRSSIFINPDPAQVEAAKMIGADRVELYTGGFAKTYPVDPQAAVENHTKCAHAAAECGIQLNAGHDLSLDNLKYYGQHVYPLAEVSIGHALISAALYYGISNIIGMYQNLLR